MNILFSIRQINDFQLSTKKLCQPNHGSTMYDMRNQLTADAFILLTDDENYRCMPKVGVFLLSWGEVTS